MGLYDSGYSNAIRINLKKIFEKSNFNLDNFIIQIIKKRTFFDF